jgi:cytochrome o ubiquinol oxidase subunit 1
MAGVALQIVQIIASFMQKRKLLDVSGDPWDGRTLEWATPSTPPFYNFAVIPAVTSRDAFLAMKQQGLSKKPIYEDIHMPRNTASGIYISAFAFLVGFGFVWHLVWLAIVGLVGVIVCTITRTFNEDVEYTVPAAEAQKLEETHIKKINLVKKSSSNIDDEMGLLEFVKIVINWVLGIIRNKKWRTW